jgi:hypothetical protein
MADLVFNIAKGRFAQYAANVDAGSPANARLVVVVINTTATDATLRDLDTLAAIEADANTAEVTNSGYARKVLAGADVTLTTDDTNDRTAVDITDQTWTSVGAGTAWTDVVICYDADSTTGTDSDLIPLVLLDAVATPAGGDITLVINTTGIATAS